MERNGQFLSRYAGKTVLAVGAHPDDLEIGIGGLLAKLRRHGARVVMAVVCVPSELEVRLREQHRAAEVLGGEMRMLFAERCSRVEDVKGYELVDRFEGLIDELKPAAMLSHGKADFHHDHILTHHACLESRSSGTFDVFCYYPTATRRVAVSFKPDAYVDISDTIDEKIASINAHASQFSTRSMGTHIYRDIAKEQGIIAGVDYAEGLEIVRMKLP